MFDTSLIPPIFASILAYFIAVKKFKISQFKTISDIQSSAVELVQKAEEQIKNELKKTIEQIQKENEELKIKVNFLEKQIFTNDALILSLKEEIFTLKTTIDHYKKMIDESFSVIENNKKEIQFLRKLAFNKEGKSI